MRRLLALFALLAVLGVAALAQSPEGEADDGDNGFILNFIEERISGPGRRIRVQDVSGALSSQARVGLLTVADDEGVWLRLEGVEIDWSRRALLRRRLEVERLAVGRIEFIRRPVPSEATVAERLPEVEAQPFRLPELPVSVRIAELSLPQIDLAEAALGQPARLAAAGSANLAQGELSARLDVDRLDGAGGALDLALDFSNATGALDVDLGLTEPEGGVVATLLDIEGRPAIDVALAGEGPLDALDLDFSFDAGAARIASGIVRLRGAPDGRSFEADFTGALAPVVPAPYRPFFAGETSVEVAGVARSAGGFRLDRLAVSGAELELTGALETAADGFPRSLTLSGRLGDPRGEAVLLPVPGESASIRSAVLHLAYGQGRRWSGLVALDRLVAGEVEIEDLTLTLGGLAENLDDPAARNLTLALDGVATGVWSQNPDIAAALGPRLDIFVDAALPPGGPLRLRQAQASGEGVALFAAGDVRGGAFDGRLAARLADLEPASGLAGRDLGGSVDVRLDGSLAPLSGAFDLALDGEARELRLGDPRLDGLFAGVTTLAGRVVRDETGFRTDGFRLANPQVEITSTGALAPDAADLALEARLADLAAIDPRLSGPVTIEGTATGSGGPVALLLEAEAPGGALLDRSYSGLRLGFDGELDGANLAGAVRGGGELDGQPIAITADLALQDGARRLDDLAIEVGPNTIAGGLSQAAADAPILGEVTVDAPDLAPLAALALAEASGSAQATVRLDAAETGQGITVTARANDVAAGGASLGAATLDARVVDAFGAPLVQGSLDATDLVAAGLEVAAISAEAQQTGPRTMEVTADASLAIGTEVRLAGALEQRDDGFAATLDTLSLRQGEVAAALAAPATVTVAGDAVSLTPLALDLAGGRLTARGSIAETFDLAVDLERLPLSLANTVQPALGLDGALDGRLRVTGPRDAPNVGFDVTGAGVASAATRAAGLPPASLTATGRTAGERLELDAQVAAGGVEARAAGSVPLGDGALDLRVDLAALPLPVLDRIAGNQGLAGVVSGNAVVTGTPAAPEVRFDLSGTGVSARPLAEAGLSPLEVAARGGFARGALTLDEATASNAQGLSVAASGRAPLAGPGLDLRASGAVPLAAANALLEDRSAQATGTLNFDLTATGSIAQPLLAGSASLAGGTITDPLTNLRLQGIAADVGFAGDVITIRSLSAASAAGGTISASGTVSLAAGNPADISARFDGLRYTDGSFVSTTIDGQLQVSGPLRGGGVVSGRIDLGPTEISVAEGLGGNALAIVDQVAHVATPPDVAETLRRARVGTPRTERDGGGGGGLRADIRIVAPNQIFVRGRGLDVELGGALTITGPFDDLAPVGQFDLRRGRLLILGQRIDFEQGSLTLTGNLNPQINFVARTRAEDVTAIVTVTGRVTSPEITFSSEPTLPEDEVLARVLFNRSIANLSAFQIAQLAAAAAELAGGGGGPGVLDQLRGAIGFDDLDIVTEDGGETAVRAGRYLDENIYLDVQTDTAGESRAQINLELNDNVTVRGSVATDGNSTLGVFYERDY